MLENFTEATIKAFEEGGRSAVFEQPYSVVLERLTLSSHTATYSATASTATCRMLHSKSCCVQHLEPDPLSVPVSGASPNSSQTQQLQAAWRAEQQHTVTRHSTSSNGNGTAAANGNDSEAEDDDDDDDDNVSATSDGDDGDSPEDSSLQN
eukprot:15288-Heterococcus_DN1.PRE.1